MTCSQAVAATRRRSESGPPRAARDPVEGLCGGLGAPGRADRAERGREALAIARTGEVEAVANQMDDARLQRRQRKHRGQGLAHLLRPSMTALRMSWQPRTLRSMKTLIQNFAPTVCSIQIPSQALSFPGRHRLSSRYASHTGSLILPQHLQQKSALTVVDRG